MEWIATIQKAITYIENHLLEQINYEDVAKHVNSSSYEFHRTFSFLTGMTVSSYIRNRRLSLAGMEIASSNLKITEIALKYGYETPESFTKAFSRFHGVAPKHVKENSAKLTLFNPLVIKIFMEGGKSMDYRIVTLKKQQFIAIVDNFKNEIINDETNNDVPMFWQKCINEKKIDMLLNIKKEGSKDLYGLCSPSKEGETTFEYGIGVLLDENCNSFDMDEMKKQGCKIWEVEESSYVVFDCIGEDGDCISQTWSKFYKEFLPQTGYKVKETTDFEVYPQNPSNGLFCYLYIPINK